MAEYKIPLKPDMQTDPNSAVEVKVKHIIFEHLWPAGFKSPDEIKTEHHIYDDLEGDSLDAMEILMAVEEQFCIDIDEEREGNLLTVGGFVECVQWHLARNGA